MCSRRLLILSLMLNNCLAYSSIENLKMTKKIDENVAKVLTNHLSSIENYKTLVQEYLEEYNIQTKLSKGNPVENPLFSYQMIRRVVLNRKKILNRLQKINLDLFKGLEKPMAMKEVTYKNDLIKAAEGILRLQDAYLLHPKDLLHGKIKHIQTSSKFTISDCLVLAKAAEENLNYDMNAEWTEEAHSLCLKRVSFDACSQLTLPLYEAAKLKHDETRAQLLQSAPVAKGNYSLTDYFYPIQTVFPYPTSYYEPSAQRFQKIISEQFTREYPQSRLCHKGSLLNEMETSKLYCYYLSRANDVYLLLHRYKIEVQSLSPRIITIFDVVSEEEAELIKFLAIPGLVQSQVHVNQELGDGSKVRVSETGWLTDEVHPKLSIISKRIESITGLNVINSSEQFQVANYGIGGWFIQHYDFFLTELSDVELGGATVFPLAKVHVPAIKRSATFWYNFDSIGLPDYNTMHGGCPVLYGSKWIVTKWIQNLGQTLVKMQCPIKHPMG